MRDEGAWPGTRLEPSSCAGVLSRFLPSPTDRELAADVTLSVGKNNFTAVPCDWIAGRHLARSAFITKSSPDGCNVVFLDGHAAWRKFKKMTIRNQLDVPSFWY